jgi:hypothetical protein
MFSIKIYFSIFICVILSFQCAYACLSEKTNSFWFGTVITCTTSNFYTLEMARTRCPADQVLGEVMDAYLYTNITNEMQIRTENEMKSYTIWINGKFNYISNNYFWPSNGEQITQYPHTYSYVNDHSTYYDRTTPIWILNIPNSNSYLNAVKSNTLANSILCLNKNLLSLRSNPCSTTDSVNNTFWFGTLVSCKRDVYSFSFAKDHCPSGQVLAEIMDASLYTNITQEVSSKTKNEAWKFSIWLNGKYDFIQDKYFWPSNGELITQYPRTYSYVNDHSTYYSRTSPQWILNIPNSNSYLNAVKSDALANSFLCLNKDLLRLHSNPCSETDRVNNTFWFGTLISCKRDVYSLSFAKDHCPSGQVLAEIMDDTLYLKISNEISNRIGNNLYTIWLNGKYDSIQDKYIWPSNGNKIIQFPPTYNYVFDHSTYSSKTTLMWRLDFLSSKSYLNSVKSDTIANSFLCLNKNQI